MNINSVLLFFYVSDNKFVCYIDSWIGSFQIVLRWTLIMHTTCSQMGGKAKRTQLWSLRPERRTRRNSRRPLTWTGHGSWSSRTNPPHQLTQSQRNFFHHLLHRPNLSSTGDTFLRYNCIYIYIYIINHIWIWIDLLIKIVFERIGNLDSDMKHILRPFES